MKRLSALCIVILMAGGLLVVACGSTDESEPVSTYDPREEYTQEDYEAAVAAIHEEDDYFTDEEQSYVDDLGATSQAMGEASATVAETAALWPYWGDEETLQMAGALATWMVSWDEWKDRDAPSKRFVKLNTLWKRGLRTFSRAAKTMASGIDNLDAGQITKATALMQSAVTSVERATAEMEELQDLYGY